MQAIVSALATPLRELADEVCGELNALLGKGAVAAADRPRLAYHAAAEYRRDAVERALARRSAAERAFHVETHGLGVFRAPRTSLFLHVTPDDALRAFHDRLHDAVAVCASGAVEAYAPETWTPHVTIAAGDVPESAIPRVEALLARRDYRLRVPVTNICLVPDTADAASDWLLFHFAT